VKIEPYGKAVGVSIAIGVGSAFVYWLYRKKRPIGYGDAHSAVGGGSGYAAEVQVDAATNAPALEQPQTTERFEDVGAVAETVIGGGADAEAEAEAEAETPGGLGVRSASYIHATTAAAGTAGGGQALEFVPGKSDHAHAHAPSQLSSAKLIAHGMPFRLPSIGASESETRSASPVPPMVPDDDGSDTMSLSGDALEKAKADEEANRPFVPLLILSALSVAFAHGGNDVGNAVGPLGVVWEVSLLQTPISKSSRVDFPNLTLSNGTSPKQSANIGKLTHLYFAKIGCFVEEGLPRPFDRVWRA
jgi:phosphate/sulfate permease